MCGWTCGRHPDRIRLDRGFSLRSIDYQGELMHPSKLGLIAASTCLLFPRPGGQKEEPRAAPPGAETDQAAPPPPAPAPDPAAPAAPPAATATAALQSDEPGLSGTVTLT